MPNWETNPFVLHPSCPLEHSFINQTALRVKEFEFSWNCRGWSFPSWWENPKLSVCNICPGLNIYLLIACIFIWFLWESSFCFTNSELSLLCFCFFVVCFFTPAGSSQMPTVVSWQHSYYTHSISQWNLWNYRHVDLCVIFLRLTAIYIVYVQSYYHCK